MDEKPRIDLKKHQLRKFNRWQLLKILFYTLAIIGILSYLMYSLKNSKKENVEKIESLEIEL